MANEFQDIGFPYTHAALIVDWEKQFKPLVDEFNFRADAAIAALSTEKCVELYERSIREGTSMVEVGRELATLSGVRFNENELLALGFKGFNEVVERTQFDDSQTLVNPVN